MFRRMPCPRANRRCVSSRRSQGTWINWSSGCRGARLKQSPWSPPASIGYRIYQKLERAGLEVVLVNARHLKRVPGRKTDILDCQWLQQMHSYGLLNGSFRPADDICVLRTFLRHRGNLVAASAQQVLHMQRALDQMNIHLHHVVSDLDGDTGLAILDAILAGERDPKELVKLRHPRISKRHGGGDGSGVEGRLA